MAASIPSSILSMMICGPSGFPSPPPMITPKPAIFGMVYSCVMYDGEEGDMVAEGGGDTAFPSGELLFLNGHES